VITIPVWAPPARFVARFIVFGVCFVCDRLFVVTDEGTRFLVTVAVIGASGIGRALSLFVPLAASVVRYGIRREIEDIKVEAERRTLIAP